MGLRLGWLVAIICAVGDVFGVGCGADGGVALGGVEGVAWAAVAAVDCTFFAVGGVAERLFFWVGCWARVARLGCSKKPWPWSVAVAKVGTGRGGVASATCTAVLALAARAV